MQVLDNFEVAAALESIVLLVDSREQPTKKLQERIEAIGWPTERIKLNVGDYSCKTTAAGEVVDLSGRVAIERKMSLDELCMCFGRERERFKREFERAKASGTRVYLLIEGASWEKILDGKYRSRYNPKALTASILAYQIRYDLKIVFCDAKTSGRMIREILYREMKYELEERPSYDIFGGGPFLRETGHLSFSNRAARQEASDRTRI